MLNIHWYKKKRKIISVFTLHRKWYLINYLMANCVKSYFMGIKLTELESKYLCILQESIANSCVNCSCFREVFA